MRRASLPSEFPETRNSLLIRIQDPGDGDAWAEFASLYRPVVYRIARLRGLQDADAQDLSQKVLVSLSHSIGKWQIDPDRAKFRTWLTCVVRNAIIDELRRHQPDQAGGGSTCQLALDQFANEDQIAEQLVHESRREIFRNAARVIRCEFEDSTWQAFWLTTVEGLSPTEAASRLGQSVGSVYTARSRVMSRLKEKVRDYDSEHM